MLALILLKFYGNRKTDRQTRGQANKLILITERMGECAMINKLGYTRSESKQQMCQYHSIEFSINGLVPYLFRTWNTASPFVTILVKEGSDILPRLKTGDTLHVKCYLSDSVYRSEHLQTAIRHIAKDDQGRFKGHYLVDLEILDRQN